MTRASFCADLTNELAKQTEIGMETKPHVKVMNSLYSQRLLIDKALSRMTRHFALMLYSPPQNVRREDKIYAEIP